MKGTDLKKYIVAGALALATILAPAPAHAADPDHKFIHTNIGSGSECLAADGEDCLAALDSNMASFSPTAVTVVEACASDVATFQARHPGWQTYFVPLSAYHAGCGEAKGQFVASPVIERTALFDLPDDPTTPEKNFQMGCADVGDIWVCAVHLVARFTPEDQWLKDAQVEAVKDATVAWSKVAIGGDYNMVTGNNALDVFRNNGYVETDKADNAATSGDKKFDHIWYHRSSGVVPTSVSGSTWAQTYSSHRLLRGTVLWG